ncbi:MULTISPECIES: asparagine synthetase B family protein [unclassified Luteibacter]|uniref:asparagine synthetase B family protein n=1 Tax=Luteibacter sp. PvP019 TaxID=3156436 RepID=UPI003395BC4F
MSGLLGCWKSLGSSAQDADGILARTHADASTTREPQVLSRCGSLSLSSFSSSRRADGGTLRSPSGRYLFTLSGDIYGRRGHPADGGVVPYRCRLKTFAEALDRLGIVDAVRGMDAGGVGCLWDEDERCLWLFRDRAGERSLYYRPGLGHFTVSSCLRSIAECPGDMATISPDAVCAYLRFGYVPAPLSIYRDVYKLEPGTLKRFEPTGAPGHAYLAQVDEIPYWDTREHIARSEQEGRQLTFDESVGATHRAIDQSVARRSFGAGTFLSGGVDSSIVTAVLQSHSATPVDTFTVGFDDPGHDESAWAAKVVAALGVRNTHATLAGHQVLDLLGKVPAAFCEPFADSSQIPSLLACQLASSDVGAVLTGDGGDELFFGHSSYSRAMRNARMAQRIPGPLRRAAGRYTSARGERSRLGGVPAVIAEASLSTLEQCYMQRVSKWRHPEQVVRNSTEPGTVFTDPVRQFAGGSDMQRVMYLDLKMDLAEGLMTKVDRCAAAYGIVARHPFLDADVMQAAWRIPARHLFAGGEHKAVLKAVLENYLPRELVYRPKVGFGAPVSRWLRGPLRDWAEHHLDPVTLESQGIFDAGKVTALWRDFQSGCNKWHTHLWPILMFQAWMTTRLS